MLYWMLLGNILIVATMGFLSQIDMLAGVEPVLYIVFTLALSIGYGVLAMAVLKHWRMIEAQAMMALMVIYNSTAVLKVLQAMAYH